MAWAVEGACGAAGRSQVWGRVKSGRRVTRRQQHICVPRLVKRRRVVAQRSAQTERICVPWGSWMPPAPRRTRRLCRRSLRGIRTRAGGRLAEVLAAGRVHRACTPMRWTVLRAAHEPCEDSGTASVPARLGSSSHCFRRVTSSAWNHRGCTLGKDCRAKGSHEVWSVRLRRMLTEQLYGKHAAALYAQAADFNKTARFYYMKAQDAYYLANAQASYDDWRRARRQWDYFYRRK